MSEEPGGYVLQRLSPRRLWILRVLTVMVPVVVLVAAETILRMFGLFRPEPAADSLGNHANKVLSFPEWDESIRMPRPADAYRIFSLGGSTAMGFGVNKPYAALLEERLRGRLPDRRWEVINGGRPGVGSGLVLEALEQACQFDPNLVVVCLGHNEFLEVIFLEPEGIVATLEKVGRFCQQFSIVNGARRLVRPVIPDVKLKRHRELLSRGQYPFIRSTEQYEERLRYLRDRLHGMITGCQKRGVLILFVPAVPNLLWPPGDSIHGPGYGADAEKWQRLFARAQSKVYRLMLNAADHPSDKEAWSDAVQVCKELIEIDDRYAHSHYLLGLARLGVGETEAAKQELILANHHDRRGNRSNPVVSEAIMSVCRARDVPVLDVRDRFFAALPQEFQRYRQDRSRTHLFLDRCHPSEAGHALLADALFNFLSQPGRTRRLRPE